MIKIAIGELVCKKCGFKMRSPIGGISLKCPKCGSSMSEDIDTKLNLAESKKE